MWRASVGQDYLDQIRRIIGILGSPSTEDMAFIENDQARKYIKSLPRRNKQSWSSLYAKANPVALDLLSKMLVFNPQKRYTVQQLSLIHICRCRRLLTCRSRWSPYH
eukprot:TRINITY_DN7324_c0_g1_i14.p1 TRINITY_DN7324_c0_g1~~TRINITY_DN7324_c0_g1_i14.p1  ORF type:complete len:107 (+),score=19.88 TRINITY_DN7324_c0_g1_i14:3-323(+)